MAGILSINLVFQKARCDDVNRIRQLNICGLGIVDIGVLRQCPNLEVVSLSVNEVSDLGALSTLPFLREIHVRRNQVSDINQVLHLKRLRNLQALNLSDNPVSRDANYRKFVIAAIPSLRQLDEKSISTAERQGALSVFPQLAQFAPPASPYAEMSGGAPLPQKSSSVASSSSYRPPQQPPRPQSASSAQDSRMMQSHMQKSRPVPASAGGPSERAVVQAVKTLCSELSPEALRDIQQYIGSLRAY